MSHLKIFIFVLTIFLIVLFLSGCVFLISSPDFAQYLKKNADPAVTLKVLMKHCIKFHPYFVIFALLISFSIFYAFADLELFRHRYYRLAVVAVPMVLFIGIYYFENYIFPGLYQFKSFIRAPLACDDHIIGIINNLKLYHFSFLMFIVIPGALLCNNRSWHLKTVIFFLAYLILMIYGFKFINKFILAQLDKIAILKNIKWKSTSSVADLILFHIHIIIGMNLFKLADSVRKIRKRIDIGKIKKIQH